MALHFKYLGIKDYNQTNEDMERYNQKRNAESADEAWFLEHPEIITLGISTKTKDVLSNSSYTIIKSKRGGQVTAHNPGQLVVYFLYDLRRSGLTIRNFVGKLQSSIIALLAHYELKAYCIEKSPGVYVNRDKIASIGLRIQQGYTSHGISINVDNNLDIFSHITPCGNPLQQITSLKKLGISTSIELSSKILSKILTNEL